MGKVDIAWSRVQWWLLFLVLSVFTTCSIMFAVGFFWLFLVSVLVVYISKIAKCSQKEDIIITLILRECQSSK